MKQPYAQFSPQVLARSEALYRASPRLSGAWASGDAHNLDPFQTGYRMTWAFDALAAGGWSTEDVRGFEADWPTVTPGHLGGTLLRQVSALVYYLGLNADGARAWLSRLYEVTLNGKVVDPSPFAVAESARAYPLTELAGVSGQEGDAWASIRLSVRAYVEAADGDAVTAALAVDAGLSLDEVLTKRQDGVLDWSTVAVLAALREQ